jgi:hypothetical protein
MKNGYYDLVFKETPYIADGECAKRLLKIKLNLKDQFEIESQQEKKKFFQSEIATFIESLPE